MVCLLCAETCQFKYNKKEHKKVDIMDDRLYRHGTAVDSFRELSTTVPQRYGQAGNPQYPLCGGGLCSSQGLAKVKVKYVFGGSSPR
jgi:hypothetical protein